ncbi:hypothetical protein GH714_003401 [Hevea brasiliensis]|uniref:Uncharacterized protein n=1 Tax=Hevea brasiliensis TaxID=3981 RepID=A0A6A6KYI1_HEVBR|nr:hypothetical protein GH714_003401 [Hevea brasiliensis]
MKTHDVIFAQRPFVLVAEFIFYNRGAIFFLHLMETTGGRFEKFVHWSFLVQSVCSCSDRSEKKRYQNLVKSISSSAGSPVNLSKMLFSSSCSVIARAAFGKKCKDQETFIPLAKEALKMMEGFSVAELFPSIKLLRVITGIQYRLEKLHKRLDMVLENIINEHRIYRATAKTNGDQGEAEVEDIVNTLLNLQEHGDLEFPLTTNNQSNYPDCFNQVITLSCCRMCLLVGLIHQLQVEWAMSELIKNPRAMSKAQAEVRQVLTEKEMLRKQGLKNEVLKGSDQRNSENTPSSSNNWAKLPKFHPLPPLHYMTNEPMDETFWCSCENLLKLQRLSVSGLSTDLTFVYIGRYAKNLETLAVAFAGSSVWGTQCVLGGCPKLRKLEIRDCPFGNATLLSGLEKYESMRSLWMSSCNVTMNGCRPLAREMPRLNVEVMKEEGVMTVRLMKFMFTVLLQVQEEMALLLSLLFQNAMRLHI